MIRMYIVPLTASPNQSFRVTIPINQSNATFDFDCRYNSIADYWSLSVADAISGESLVSNIPLIAGEYPSANLLSQWEHLGIGSAVIVNTNPQNSDYAPNADNLGVDFALVWSDNL